MPGFQRYTDMRAQYAYRGWHSSRDVVHVLVGGTLVCVVAVAMFTQPGARVSATSTYTGVAPAPNAQTVAPRAWLAFLPTGAVDLGFGASIVEMSGTIAREQGVRNSSGGYVVAVSKGSAAERAGLRPGDIINRINGR